LQNNTTNLQNSTTNLQNNKNSNKTNAFRRLIVQNVRSESGLRSRNLLFYGVSTLVYLRFDRINFDGVFVVFSSCLNSIVILNSLFSLFKLLNFNYLLSFVVLYADSILSVSIVLFEGSRVKDSLFYWMVVY
jgi:hypothetical protein